MSGFAILDWAALTLSLFNAFLLCWLGFTVLLEADRRAVGVWISADGLFLGAAFFIAHTAILRNGWNWNSPLLDFWWKAGWWPLILSPFAWYNVILWYSGFWDSNESPLHRRQAPFFGLILILTAGLLVWMVVANPLPNLGSRIADMTGFHNLSILFPIYILACILLSLDAIIRPGPTARFLGNEARGRARPWLLASTLVLLVVCLMAAFALIWGINTFTINYETQVIAPGLMLPLTGLDVIIEILITAAILLIGQAAMVYEVFSSFSLPRSGLRKRWAFAIISGAIIAGLLSTILVLITRPETAYLILIPLLTATMTIQNRLSVREQEAEASQLRSLTRPLGMYERIFSSYGETDPLLETLNEFDQICQNLLRTEKAVVIPSGSISSFLPDRIAYPRDDLSVHAEFDTPDQSETNSEPIPLDSDGFRWAVPLTSSRGLDGWLYIGKHSDGGFFTREEINIARAAVLRLMDSLAAAEIARRLVNLQRQKQTETRLLDQRSRQILHDDILPLLHTSLLTASYGASAAQISEAHRLISNLLREAPPPPPSEIARSGLLPAIEQLARSEAELMKAELSVDMGDRVIKASLSLSQEEAETVYYAVRECLRNIGKHVQAPTHTVLKVTLKASVNEMFEISIWNNGIEKAPGSYQTASTGEGLRLHNAMLAVFGGGIHLEHLSGGETRVIIRLPIKKDISK
ncbi:histidine kinase [Leptolinea sp. HRD-7]|nr:histidine kinase [Leptolinea sp. HRD-7]